MTIVATDENGFNHAGAVRLSDDALTMALEFAASIGAGPQGRRLVSFDWSRTQSVRKSREAAWEDIGPGLALVAYGRHEVPPHAIHRQGGLAFAAKIPADVLLSHPRRLIVRDDLQYFQLALT